MPAASLLGVILNGEQYSGSEIFQALKVIILWEFKIRKANILTIDVKGQKWLNISSPPNYIIEYKFVLLEQLNGDLCLNHMAWLQFSAVFCYRSCPPFS